MVELGDRFNKTLGFLPPAAYKQKAGQGTLLAATINGRLAGYTLFGLPGQRVRLTHLCVDPKFRKRGIARLLVEEIAARHADRLGIVLKCRKDYECDAMWTKLGFEVRNEVDGRSKDRKPLVVWWRWKCPSCGSRHRIHWAQPWHAKSCSCCAGTAATPAHRYSA